MADLKHLAKANAFFESIGLLLQLPVKPELLVAEARFLELQTEKVGERPDRQARRLAKTRQGSAERELLLQC